MGTRNLIAVVQDGKYKVAQYAQWDGYPSGQGITALDFLSNPESVTKLRDNLARCRFMEPEGADKEFYKAYREAAPVWSSDPDNRTDAMKHWFNNYITRDLGALILSSIAESGDAEIILLDNIEFAADSGCEWAYVVDLDKNTFEVYGGYHSDPITPEDRFHFLAEGGERTPVKLIKSYSLGALPAADQFIADCDPAEED